MTTVSDILRKPQRIADNMTSRQMFVVLDSFLEKALIPLADTSHSFREFAAEIVALSVVHRRRISDETTIAAFRSIFDPSSPSVHQLVESGIDRGFVFQYVSLIATIGERLMDAHVCAVRSRRRTLTSVSEELAATTRILGSGKYIIAATTESAYWLSAAVDFRDRIVEKYFKLVYKGSIRDSQRTGGNLDKDDLFSYGYLTTVRAVEKFNSKKGVLTSYIALWLRGVFKSQSSQSVGLAYTSKFPNNDAYGISLDDVASDLIDESTSSLDYDPVMLANMSLIDSDPDVRSALVVSGIKPPVVADMETQSKQNAQTEEQR